MPIRMMCLEGVTRRASGAAARCSGRGLPVLLLAEGANPPLLPALDVSRFHLFVFEASRPFVYLTNDVPPAAPISCILLTRLAQLASVTL